MAFPGRKLFCGDDLAAGEAVTRERLEQATREAIDLGIYRGAEVWPFPTEAPEPTLFDFVLRWSAGTDFALRYARSGLCGREPVEPAMLDEIIHLHSLRNALAAASIGDPVSVRTTRLRQRILRDESLRDAMLEFGWLPTRHGSLPIALRDRPSAGRGSSCGCSMIRSSRSSRRTSPTSGCGARWPRSPRRKDPWHPPRGDGS